MEPFASPIHIPIVLPTTVQRLVFGGHLLCAAIFLSALPLNAYSIAAVCCVLLSLGIQHWSDVDLVTRVYAVLLRSDDQWCVVTHDGEILATNLTGSTFVSPWLVIVSLKPRGQRKVRIVLTRENTNKDAFRRLFVRLTVPMSQPTF